MRGCGCEVLNHLAWHNSRRLVLWAGIVAGGAVILSTRVCRRLGRCASIITGEDSSLPRVKPFKVWWVELGPRGMRAGNQMRRQDVLCGSPKPPPTDPPSPPTPLQYTYEKEIVMYAYFKRLDYFSTGGRSWVGGVDGCSGYTAG